MTSDSMNLQELLEKTTDPDFLQHMIGFTAQRLMELEVAGRTVKLPHFRGVFDPQDDYVSAMAASIVAS